MKEWGEKLGWRSEMKCSTPIECAQSLSTRVSRNRQTNLTIKPTLEHTYTNTRYRRKTLRKTNGTTVVGARFTDRQAMWGKGNAQPAGFRIVN